MGIAALRVVREGTAAGRRRVIQAMRVKPRANFREYFANDFFSIYRRLRVLIFLRQIQLVSAAPQRDAGMVLSRAQQHFSLLPIKRKLIRLFRIQRAAEKKILPEENSAAVTFLFGLLIGKRRTKEKAAAEAGRPIHQLSKVWVGVSFAVNLAILFFYKYFDFTVDNINVIRGWMGLAPVTPGFDVLLPVGISFYIFQALSYVVDVYRGDVRMETNFIKYAAFVSFFPQLVAGPIERSTNLLTQFDTPHKLEYDNVRDGLLRMVWGFFLKIVIADRAAILVNQVFNYCNYYEGPTVLIAAVLFAFQVYGDFAGYSNIAIGAAQVMGFKLMKNFERPYLAVSVSDFWRRWHISLSTWFRDYLYIPLGGNRKGTVRKYINQMIVMLVSGLWHGAAWNFVLWGFMLFVFIALEKFCIGGFLERHRFLSRLYFLFLIPQTWVVFRISDLGELGDYFSRLYPFLSSGESVFAGDLLRQLESYWWLFALGILLATPWPRRFYEKYRATPLVWLPLFAVFWLCLYLIATGTGNPFLYARF